MCGLLNFHFIVIKMYVWLAEFSLYYNEDVYGLLDMACCFLHVGHMYGLLFFLLDMACWVYLDIFFQFDF